MKGFRNFLMQEELIIIAVGLVVALAFSTLIKSCTDSILTPLVNAAQGGGKDHRALGGRSMDNALTLVRSLLPLCTSSSSWR
jgi:large-conductance mechanosensitive channel